MERRLVATVAIGRSGQEWADVSHPWMRRYAERCGADFFCLTGSTLKSTWAGFSKLLLGELLTIFDRLLYIDCDILVAPNAPSLFDLVPPDAVGATRIDHLSSFEAPVIAKGWVSNDIQLTQALFGDIGWRHCYYNSGTLMFSKAHKPIFDACLRGAREWSALPTDRKLPRYRAFADQSLFNYFTQALKVPVFDLGHQYNHTRAFNRRNHRFQSYFYHYAGSRAHRRGSRLRQMRIDSWLLRRRKLHEFLTRNPWIAWITDKV